MGVYSSLEPYPSIIDEITTMGTHCKNCNRDCPGAYLIIRGVTYDDD